MRMHIMVNTEDKITALGVELSFNRQQHFLVKKNMIYV
jgi:hypothetical protein